MVAGYKNGKQVLAAVQRGITRLRSLQEGGRWRGFPTLAGESDVWVTAFVSTHLRDLAPRHVALAEARAYLAAQHRPNSGWSYGGDVPPDADSTAWCLMALRGSPQILPSARGEAQEFLSSHLSEMGTATYREDSGIRDYIGVGPAISLAGWTSAHPDVSVAALLAGVPPFGSDASLTVLRRLAACQSGAGFWDAYWWRGPLYTTALLLRAVQRVGYRLPEPQAQCILAALKREQLTDGGFALGASTASDPFTTALALECYAHLAYLGGEQRRRAAVSALLELQCAKLGWSGEYTMRIPAPDIVDPTRVFEWTRGTGGGNSFVMDTDGVFATTLACFALLRSHAVEIKGIPEEKPVLSIPSEPFLDDTVVTLNRR